MKKPLTLVVDDEADIRELLEITLARMNIDTRTATNVEEAKAQLQQHDFDLCLTDMRLPDTDGLELVKHIREGYDSLPVAIISAHGSMDIAIKAMKIGAFDFVSKPVDLESLRQLISSALKLKSLSDTDRRSRNTLLGNSEAMQRIRSMIAKLARTQASVYISGESGSGKELVARLIHQKSPRSNQSFVAINCGAIPIELMESEFFGHKKGSFTGASSDKQGLFQAAHGGTLFLDEVADLPTVLQVKLLRAIQEKKIRPIGEQQEIAVDVRILSATHKDLEKMVQEGQFRQDLFYRINVIELTVPPLRERVEDIAELVDHFLTNHANAAGVTKPILNEEALQQLIQYHFPGNVRELENIVERALAFSEDNTIKADDLTLRLHDTPAQNTQVNALLPKEETLESYLEEIEKKAIVQALEKNRWNKTATAKDLGMTFRSLRYRLKKLGLDEQ